MAMPIRHGITMLEAFCEALPFLRQVPAHLLGALDTSTLHLPAGQVQRLRTGLERQLATHVMTYRRQPSSDSGCGGLHLCRLLVPAQLSASEVALIVRAEAACEGDSVVFVAYRRPLELRGDRIGESR